MKDNVYSFRERLIVKQERRMPRGMSRGLLRGTPRRLLRGTLWGMSQETPQGMSRGTPRGMIRGTARGIIQRVLRGTSCALVPLEQVLQISCSEIALYCFEEKMRWTTFLKICTHPHLSYPCSESNGSDLFDQ